MEARQLGMLHYGVSYEEYNTQPGVRSSHLYEIKKSPAHLQVSLATPRRETDALAMGKKFHSMIENAERFMDTFIVEPVVNRRTNAGKQELEDFYANAPKDKIILEPEEVEILTGMARAFVGHKILKNMLKNSIRESSLWVEDPETGLTIKCRPDFITEHGFPADAKTCLDATPDTFIREIFSDRAYNRFYILQAAHYAHCLKLARIGNGDSMTLVAIEKKPPFGVMIYPLDAGCLDVGDRWRAKLMRTYADCVNKGEWPCYPERAWPVLIPQWVVEEIGDE